MDQNTPGLVSSNLSDLEIAYSLGGNDAGASHADISARIGRSRPCLENQPLPIQECGAVTVFNI